ncbi:MAG: arginine--tRNA ligase [Actinomycetota bacterium]|nr:arginine--tRNA ligase [Actinomycetota bacterium]
MPADPNAGDAVRVLEAALGDATGAEVSLERPGDPSHGDYATNVALRLAATRGQPPRTIAEELVEKALGLPAVERAEVAGPGFVNLWLAPAWYGEALAEILERREEYGGGSAAEPERIQVEMVSANPTGPLTVASARNGAYGDSVTRLLEFAGHDVEREFYVNDAGTQAEQFLASVEAIRAGGDPPEGGYTGAYMREVAKEADPVAAMLESLRETLARFRIEFDSWVRQSSFEAKLDETIAALETYEADGARWVRTSPHGDDKDRVIVRSEAKGGKPAYVAWDAAYLRHKFERGYDRLIYVLGADHHGYVGRLKGLAGAFGFSPDRVEILIYQLVQLIEHGEAKKMSKRSGDAVFLDELLDAIGVDAARWYLVSRGHDQPIDIDVDLASERSAKNPVFYVQYAHARIAGILRNAGNAEVSPEPPAELEPEERDLIKRLAEFPGVVAEATERRGPHAIPIYAIKVADDFHRFYHEHRVLESDAQAFRLALVRATQSVIGKALDLVGVDAPERM